jgi:hypothetical protein
MGTNELPLGRDKGNPSDATGRGRSIYGQFLVGSVRGLLIGASRSSGHRQSHCFDNPLDQPQADFRITGWSVSSLKVRFFAALDSDND